MIRKSMARFGRVAQAAPAQNAPRSPEKNTNSIRPVPPPPARCREGAPMVGEHKACQTETVALARALRSPPADERVRRGRAE
jgi:hypothetical protein